MRFGGFAARNYTLESFTIDAEGSIRLITDYARYSGLRQFAIEFAASPRFEDMWYNIYACTERGADRLVPRGYVTALAFQALTARR